MASQAVNVLRWSALGAGVVYGFMHQRTLFAQAEKHHDAAAYAHQESLIKKAKAEWARTHPPKTSSSGVITDPNDKNFDLEKFLLSKFEENK